MRTAMPVSPSYSPELSWRGAQKKLTRPWYRWSVSGFVYHFSTRLSRRKVLHQTDGYLWLVFSAPRSIPAFPTPLRRVIGHHWPWYGYQGQWLLWGPGGAVEPALRHRWPHMRVTPAPRGAGLPSHALRRDQSYGPSRLP